MLLFLAVLASTQARAADVPFDETVRSYFRLSAVCWGTNPSKIPDRRTVEREIRAIGEAADRFFPECPGEARRYLFVLMVSESEGNLGKAKPDPKRESLGVMGVKLREARIAGDVYDLPYGNRDDKWFRSCLIWQARAAILYGSAVLRMTYTKAGHDWTRAILNYKYGEFGLRDRVGRLDGEPIESLGVWRRFDRRLRLVGCIEEVMVERKSDCQECSRRHAEEDEK